MTTLATFTEIVTAASQAPVIATTQLPDATVGTAYDVTVAASGDTPITFTVSDGVLPDGLSLDAATGDITGTPAGAGQTSFTITATNATGSDSQDCTLAVAAPPPVAGPPAAAGPPPDRRSPHREDPGSPPRACCRAQAQVSPSRCPQSSDSCSSLPEHCSPPRVDASAPRTGAPDAAAHLGSGQLLAGSPPSRCCGSGPRTATAVRVSATMTTATASVTPRRPDLPTAAAVNLDQLADAVSDLEGQLAAALAKILMFDDLWITTSFNWLSFEGDPNRPYRREEGTLVQIPSEIDTAYERYIEALETDGSDPRDRN